MGERLFKFFNDWVYEIKYKKGLSYSWEIRRKFIIWAW